MTAVAAFVELLPPREATPANPLWHKLRAEGVSASEIAAVLGLSPWESAFSLYWSKLNGWNIEENPEMAAGKRAESVVADWFAEGLHGDRYLRPAGLYASVERPWQLATPDRLIYGFPTGTGRASIVAILECKYVIEGWNGWGESGTDQIPLHYRSQCLQQLDVMGLDEANLAAWHGAELRTYIIRRDEKDQRVMRAAGERFYRRMQTGEVPDIDGHSATLQILKALHPDLEDRKQEISPLVADAYRRARLLKTRSAAVADLWEARLRAEMGNARRAVCGDRFVASRSIYELGGEDYDLHALDGIRPVVDKLNPARASKK